MEPDIRMLDKYKSELKEMDKNISLLQSKLRGVGKIFLFPIVANCFSQNLKIVYNQSICSKSIGKFGGGEAVSFVRRFFFVIICSLI